MFSWSNGTHVRFSINPNTYSLNPNLNNAESLTSADFDMLSSGFKLRSNSVLANASAGKYIFAAFAENPFKYSLAR